MTDDAEFDDLILDEEARARDAAADLSLAALTLLGSYKGVVTPEYRLGVAKALIGVLSATSSIRLCLADVYGPLDDDTMALILVRALATLFEVDSKDLLRDLVADANA
jgi:hypothetical protein